MTKPIQPPARTSGIPTGLPHHGAAPQLYQSQDSFPPSRDKKPSFTDLIQNRCYSFSSRTGQPARKVSLEDLVTELLTPSSNTEDDTPSRQRESIENIVKNGGRVALVTEDDGTGSGQSNVKDIVILQHGKFKSLRNLMDGREFLEQTDETCPFRYLPELRRTSEGSEDVDDDSPFSNLQRLSSEVEVEEESFLNGLSRKVSFQEIMSQRDYGLLAPPTSTQLSSDDKKGSYHDINKRQRIVFLENLIHSALDSTKKVAEEENTSSHSRMAAFARSNKKYQKMPIPTKETSIGSPTTDIANDGIAVDGSSRARRTGNVSSSHAEIQVNPYMDRPSTIVPILPPPQSLAPLTTDHRRQAQRRMRPTTENEQTGRRGGRSHSPKQKSMPTTTTTTTPISNSVSRSASPKHKSMPTTRSRRTTPSRRNPLSPHSGSTRAKSPPPLKTNQGQQQPPLVAVAASPADVERQQRRSPRRPVDSSSRMADQKARGRQSEERSSSLSPPKPRRRDNPIDNDHNSGHRRRNTTTKDVPPSR